MNKRHFVQKTLLKGALVCLLLAPQTGWARGERGGDASQTRPHVQQPQRGLAHIKSKQTKSGRPVVEDLVSGLEQFNGSRGARSGEQAISPESASVFNSPFTRNQP